MVFEEYEEENEVVMVVDQTLLKQVVLKKRKADWCLLEIVVFEDREWHLKTALVPPKKVQDDEYEDG